MLLICATRINGEDAGGGGKRETAGEGTLETALTLEGRGREGTGGFLRRTDMPSGEEQ